MEINLPGSSFLTNLGGRPMGRALIAPLARLRSCIEFPLGLLADIFAEDLCLLCGGKRNLSGPAGDRAGDYAGDAAAMSALTGPVTGAVCGIRFKNHPVCFDCARGFETARTAGVLGTILPGGSVVTVSGDLFGAESEALLSPARPSAGEERLIHVIAPYMTNDNVLQIVHLAKYKGATSLLGIMVRAMVRAIDRFGIEFPDNAVMVPVPLFAGERRALDHTRRICASLASALSLPVAAGGLKKIRITCSQSRTPRQGRAQNVRNAFSATGFEDYHVFLVDDVVTSGSTAGACSAALAAAGARSVTLLCFGRAL